METCPHKVLVARDSYPCVQNGINLFPMVGHFVPHNTCNHFKFNKKYLRRIYESHAYLQQMQSLINVLYLHYGVDRLPLSGNI